MADYKTFKFETDKPLKVRFTYAEPREKEWDDGGKSYSWGVRSNGELGYINPSEKLVELLQKLGVGKDDSVTITKRAVEYGSGRPGFGFDVEKDGQVYYTYERTDATETPQNRPESTETPAAHVGIPELGAQMSACFREAEAILGNFGTGSADVKQEVMGRVAVSLFIALHQ